LGIREKKVSVSSMLEEGFLGTEVDGLVEAIRRENAGWFSLCEDLNRFGHEVVAGMRVTDNDDAKVFACLLFMRILNLLQGVVILAERGMAKEADVLLRAMLDALFVVGALEKDLTIYDTLIHDSDSRFLKDLNRLKHNTTNEEKQALLSFFPDPERDLDQLIESVKSKFKGIQSKTIPREQLAVASGHYRLYLSNYAMLSSTVHVDAKDMREHLKLDENGRLRHLMCEPTVKDIGFTLFNAAEYLLLGLIHIFHILRLNTIGPRIDRLYKRCRKLGEAIPSPEIEPE
jgi:hypothetical protein